MNLRIWNLKKSLQGGSGKCQVPSWVVRTSMLEIFFSGKTIQQLIVFKSSTVFSMHSNMSFFTKVYVITAYTAKKYL